MKRDKPERTNPSREMPEREKPGRDLSEWTLREKIGQMVMCGFDGKQPTDGIRMLIREYRIGGIIYFRRNVGTAEETASLSAALQEAAADVSDVPLWIAVDQEGGMVARIDRDVAVMPGNMALGAARDAGLAYETALASARDLRRMGINFNLAPCLDVNNNPANPVIGVRSYGERPELVAKLGSAAIRGYQAGGVAACAKHFPGHGDTVADSHLELPVVPHDPRRLDRVELAPFRAAVEAGVDAVMTAHVRFPAHEDRAIPATLSPRILTGLLRERLGFSGMIVTDCLEMKAISDTVGVGRGAVMAVKAGADLVLVSHRLDRQLKALEALHDAVLSGEIGMERIDDAVRRILAAKRRRIMAAPAAPAAGSGVPEAWDVARRACERAVTVVKNECGALPLRRELPVLAVWPEVRRSTEVDEALRPAVTLGKALETRGFRAREIVIGSEPARDEWMAVVEEARGGGYRQIVVGTYNAAFAPGQRELVKALMDSTDGSVVAVALRNPYDLLQFPDVPAFVACYENRPLMMEALAAVLAGDRPAAGRLPVTLSDAYPFGHGLAG
jgi:beta-N-acetylhexosaminidase